MAGRAIAGFIPVTVVMQSVNYPAFPVKERGDYIEELAVSQLELPPHHVSNQVGILNKASSPGIHELKEHLLNCG